ncbi:anti-sigma factor [Shewanella putrefaciens]|uniref:anti-sigma factor n=1 Tax=Shewanella putrefaciens TaxID=24 RepID=UPI0024316948|nr:anti-sigma factor [Shewanella putrefaciens]MCA1897152.1 anti-sigma factor [Shewanella putrefaciens]
MNNVTVNTEETEARKQVSIWYHQQSLEMPSAKLDQDILALAQTHLVDMDRTRKKPVMVPFWRRFPLALSSVASLIIVISVAILNRPQIDDVAIVPELSMSAPVPQTIEPMVAAKMRAGQSEQAERRSVDAAQSEAMQARSRMAVQATEESLEQDVTSIAAASPVLPQHGANSEHVGRDIEDKESLEKSLQRLKVFIDTKENEQALALEQILLTRYPELAMTEELNNSKDELSQTLRAEFKMLQQQLHQAVK